MKYKTILLLTLLLSFSGQVEAQKAEIQIIDSQSGEPLFNVLATNTKKNVLLASSDTSGMLCFDYKKDISDTVLFIFTGYKTLKLPFSEIKGKGKKIFLHPVYHRMKEIVVKGYSTNKIIQKAIRYYENNYCNNSYIARGERVRLISSDEGFFEFNQDVGFIATTSNASVKAFDRKHHFEFYPKHNRYSLSYLTRNPPTVLPAKYSSSKGGKFNSGVHFSAAMYRSIEAFSPLLKKESKYYSFKLDTITSENYIVFFSTKKENFPKKISISCRGLLYIDRNNYQLNKLVCHNLNDIHFSLGNLSRNRSKGFYPAYTSEITVIYTLNSNTLYPKQIHAKRQWLNNPYDKNFHFFYPPSRYNPHKQHIKEYEALCFYHYKPYNKTNASIILGEQWDKLFYFMNIANWNTWIYYKPDFWNNYESKLLDSTQDIFRKLSFDMPILQQFEKNSNTYYYPVNYHESLRTNERAIETWDYIQLNRQNVWTSFEEVFE